MRFYSAKNLFKTSRLIPFIKVRVVVSPGYLFLFKTLLYKDIIGAKDTRHRKKCAASLEIKRHPPKIKADRRVGELRGGSMEAEKGQKNISLFFFILYSRMYAIQEIIV